MKAKLTQKCPPTQQEESYLAKTFKFFDIHNKGEVNFDQFYRTVEKLGVIIDKNVSVFNILCYIYYLGSLKDLLTI